MPKISQTLPNSRSKIDIRDRIKPMGFDPSEGIKMLLYGRAGTGKTTLWGTFPSPILAILCSGGKRPGELRSLDTPENRQRIHQVIIRETADIEQLAEGLEKPKERLGIDFKTVVLDHVSGFQDMKLAEILGIDRLPEQKHWGMAAREQYGQCSTECKEQLAKLYGLHMNFVCVAHERDFGGEESSKVTLPHVGAGVIPSLASWLNGASDYICQMFIRQKEVVKERVVTQGGKKIKKRERVKLDEVEYCLRTAANDTFMTRFRCPRGIKLPPEIVDPTYDKIISLIRGHQQDATAT